MKAKFTTPEDPEKYYLGDVLRFDLTAETTQGMVVKTLHHEVFVPFNHLMVVEEAGSLYLEHDGRKIEDHDYLPFLGGVGDEGRKFLAWVKKHKNILGQKVQVVRGA